MSFAQQHPEFAPDATVDAALDELLSDMRRLEGDLMRASEQLSAAPATEHEALLNTLGELTDRFEARGGYDLDRRLDAALQQLGLGMLDRSRSVATLSGGERSRLALAAALSTEAELLLLDEPTNDLDDAGIGWLEERLAHRRGAIVVVSHDRAFLETFAQDIVLVDGGRLRRYGDGYSGFLRARAAERDRTAAEYEAWRLELARHERLVTSGSLRLNGIARKQELPGFGHGAFRARSSDHGAVGRIRQAKERVARLRASAAQKPAEPLRFSPGFDRADDVEQTTPAREAEPLVRLDGIVLDGQAAPSPETRELRVEQGDRWLISGPNGVGKTTLLRAIAGELTPRRGVVHRRPDLRIAWLRQEIVPRSDRRAVDAFADALRVGPDEAEASLTALGILDPADYARPLSALSVGQRRRLEVCIAVAAPSDLLLLDEPTNHLSPDLVDQLEGALADYPGAVLTVTHDRRWRQNATAAEDARLLEVVPGGAVVKIVA